MPGSQVSIQTRRGAPSGPGARVTVSPARVGTTRGSGRWGARSSRCSQGRALQLDEPPLARGVHRFQHEEPAVRRFQAEVVVELAGKRERLGLEAVEASRAPGRPRLGQGVGGAAVGQHGPDLSPKRGGHLGVICASTSDCLVAAD